MTSDSSENAPRTRIVVHALADAVAALEAAERHGEAVLLLSAAGAAQTGGAAWWRELVDQARARVPGATATAVLDCADAPGLALAAIREGVEAVSVDVAGDARRRIAEIAEQAGVALLHADRTGALDLAAPDDPQAACENLFAHGPDGVANGRALG